MRKALIAWAVFALLGSAEAAGLSVSYTAKSGTPGAAGYTPPSLTINGTVYTAPIFGAIVADPSSSYSRVTFDSATWTVSGGVFTLGTLTTATKSTLNAWASTLTGAITTAINTEVSTINGLVTTANGAITNYNTQSAAQTSAAIAADATVNSAIYDVYDEVNGTRAAVTQLKRLSVSVVDNSTPASGATPASNVDASHIYVSIVENSVASTGITQTNQTKPAN